MVLGVRGPPVADASQPPPEPWRRQGQRIVPARDSLPTTTQVRRGRGFEHCRRRPDDRQSCCQVLQPSCLRPGNRWTLVRVYARTDPGQGTSEGRSGPAYGHTSAWSARKRTE